MPKHTPDCRCIPCEREGTGYFANQEPAALTLDAMTDVIKASRFVWIGSEAFEQLVSFGAKTRSTLYRMPTETYVIDVAVLEVEGVQFQAQRTREPTAQDFEAYEKAPTTARHLITKDAYTACNLGAG